MPYFDNDNKRKVFDRTYIGKPGGCMAVIVIIIIGFIIYDIF
ncbi:hypothetical protein [Terrilactibacillus laevilacticus]|uniref:Uncharacterized protein n=1 Tax=Terrilactibacillus laevilacticus TaxID=1380157 RepID=A0ABW5PMF5_9BACI|nr:hypothetical protein [Terrilactibacillus laevilacticus]